MDATLRRGFGLMRDAHVGGVFQQAPWSNDDLNSGVVFWKRSETTRVLWDTWQAEQIKFLTEKLAEPCHENYYQTECDITKTASHKQELLVVDQVPLSFALRATHKSHGIQVFTFHSAWNSRNGNPNVCPWTVGCQGPCTCNRKCCSPLADGYPSIIDHGCDATGFRP